MKRSIGILAILGLLITGCAAANASDAKGPRDFLSHIKIIRFAIASGLGLTVHYCPPGHWLRGAEVLLAVVQGQVMAKAESEVNGGALSDRVRDDAREQVNSKDSP